MKLKDLLEQLNSIASQDPLILEDDVVLVVEHDDSDECEVVKSGYSDVYASPFIVKYDEVDTWLDEMEYEDIDEAIKDSRLRRVIMLV
jgi:hypothetical protein